MGLCEKCPYFVGQMLKSRYIKFSVFFIAILLVLGIAFVKFDISGKLAYSGSGLSILPTEELKAEGDQKEMDDEGSGSEYFSIFRLINSFIPDKKDN